MTDTTMKMTISQAIGLLLEAEITDVTELKGRWGRTDSRQWSAFWLGVRAALLYSKDASEMIESLYADQLQVAELTHQAMYGSDTFGEGAPSFGLEAARVSHGATPDEVRRETDGYILNIFSAARSLQSIVEETVSGSRRTETPDAEDTIGPARLDQQEHESYGPGDVG
jgi:hypothetical protein